MCQRIKCFLIGLFYENNEPSLTRVMTAVSLLAFLAGSAYLMIQGQRWDHYETFAALTAGGGIGGQIANKYMNLTKTPQGRTPYIKNNKQED